MKKHLIIFKLIICFVALKPTNAAHFSYAANIANNLTGLNGVALSLTDTVEIGTFVNNVFTSFAINSSTNQDMNQDQTLDSGFFNYINAYSGDTNAIAGQQLAIRWNHADSGLYAIIYVDITVVGLDTTIKDQWTAKGGLGNGGDNLQNILDVSHLTTATANGANYNQLRAEARLVNATLAGANIGGVPSFEIIPEPSTYALIGGLTVLGYVCIRRRK